MPGTRKVFLADKLVNQSAQGRTGRSKPGLEEDIEPEAPSEKWGGDRGDPLQDKPHHTTDRKYVWKKAL